MIDIFSDHFLNELAKINMTQATIAGFFILFSLFLRNLFATSVIRLAHHFSSKGNEESQLRWMTVLAKPFSFIFVVMGFYLASLVLTLPEELDLFFSNLTRTIVLFTIFWVLYRSVDLISGVFTKRIGDEILYFIQSISRFAILILGVLSILQSWGINVGAFLAGLGLLGMAVALAAQDTMKNLFASLTVLLDQTFKRGDWIKTSEIEGIVEHIGLRTTMIRLFDRSLVTIPNSNIANAAVNNLSRMTNRRIQWTLSIGYESTSEQLERFIKKLRDYLEQNPNIETDPKKVTTVVCYDDFSDSSIKISCTFYTKTIKGDEFSNIKEKCLLDFKRIIDEEGISIPSPTQPIIIESSSFSSSDKNRKSSSTKKALS